VFIAVDEYCARGPQGVEVRVEDGYLDYRSGERSTRIEYEFLLNERELVIHESTIRIWDTPSGAGLIGSIERQALVRDLSAALSVLGVKHRLES